MNIFEKANKIGLRFNTDVGMLSVEDLWHLPLEALDALAVGLKMELNKQDTESFIKATRKPNHLQLRFDIAKSVIDSRLEDMENAKKTMERKKTKEKIMEIIAAKQDSALQEKSLEELEAMLRDDES